MSDNNFDAGKESLDKKNGRAKRGVLSLQERKYIEENASIKSVDEIVEVLKKSKETIEKYIFRKNLVSKDTLEVVPDAYRRIKIRDMLHRREYWKDVQKQFTPDELKMWEEHFVSLIIQFDEDLLASEELQVKKYITLEILKDRMLRQNYTNTLEIERLKKLLDIEYALGEDQNKENIESFNMTISKLQASEFDFLKEYREITNEQKDVEKKLRGSRDDRVKISQDNAQTWSTAIRLLHENKQLREKIGKQIEIMKFAALNQSAKLFNLHTYLNGDVDFPILAAESVEKKDKE